MNKFIPILLIVLFAVLEGQLMGIIPVLHTNRFQTTAQGSQSGALGNTAPPAITSVVATTVPSVVTIKISQQITDYSIEFDPFNPFSPFSQVPQTHQQSQNIGSGFIVGANGTIITNKHVVADMSASYSVITSDKKDYHVQKIYRDPQNDIAVLQIAATGLSPITLGDSSHLLLGENVIAIGTPLGEFTNTVTSGIISGLGRGITTGSRYEGYVEKLDNVIQTDAAINPGNSGGPLLTTTGEVIGINTAVAQQGQNIGFAIPVTIVKEVLARYMAQ